MQKKARSLASIQFSISINMPSRDRNIVNGLYDITNLTWRDLIGAASIPAAVKFFVLRLPRPFLRVGRRETIATYMHLGHHSRIASSFVDLCTDNKIGMHAYKYSYVATCVHIKYINSYT